MTKNRNKKYHIYENIFDNFECYVYFLRRSSKL